MNISKSVKIFIFVLFLSLGFIGMIFTASKLQNIKNYRNSFYFQDIIFSNCSYLGFAPCGDKCDNKCNLCQSYNVTLNTSTYCYNDENEKINIIKILTVIVSLNTTNFCSAVHICTYKCEDLKNSLSLSFPKYPNSTGWIIFLAISATMFIGTLLITFLIKMKPKSNKDYENI